MMYRFFTFLGLFSVSLLPQLSCKTTAPNSAELSESNQDPAKAPHLEVRRTVTPQYVVRPWMIFKFYCTPAETLPDCAEFDVMKVSSLAKAMGLEQEAELYEDYILARKKARLDQKRLDEIEAGYANAKAKGKNITRAQMDDYTFTTKMLRKDLAEFAAMTGGEQAWVKLQAAAQDPATRDRHFAAEGGQVELGWGHSCAVRLDGRLLCWGNDESGQVSGRKARIAEGSLKLPIKQVAACGDHSCAIGSGESFACWGNDIAGQSSGYLDPKKISAELKFPVRAVSTGREHTCAIGSGHSFACWGSDDLGQSSGYLYRNKRSGELKFPVRAVSTGSKHTCAIGSGESFACWGYNDHGESSGYLYPKNRSAELRFPVLAVSAGYYYTCAIGSGESFACWGANRYGERSGYLDPKNRSAELKFPVRAVSTGGVSTCAIGSGESFACWGTDDDARSSGYLDPKNRSAELRFPVLAVSAGIYHTCAIGSNRQLSCWGRNSSGQVTGRDASGYKAGDDVPEDFAMSLDELGYYDE